MLTAREYIAELKTVQAFQMKRAASSEGFPATLTRAEILMIRLIFLTNALHLSHIAAIFKSLLTESEVKESLDRLCDKGYLWTSDAFYALGRKGTGLFMPPEIGKGYTKMKISQPEYMNYRLKGGIITEICNRETLECIFTRPCSLTKYGSNYIYQLLEQFKTKYPYIEIMAISECLNERKCTMNGQFTAFSKSLKSMDENDPDKEQFLSAHEGYERYLAKLENKNEEIKNKGLYLATCDNETGMPRQRLITPSLLSENGIFITNVLTKDRIRMAFAIFDNISDGMGSGLLYNRLDLAAALSRQLDIYKPIYRIATTDKAKMEKTVQSVLEKCSSAENLKYFSTLSYEIKIMEVE